MKKKFTMGVIAIMTLVTYGVAGLTILTAQSSYGLRESFPEERKAPPAITGENGYVAWWTNKTANNNEEIMFRASTDGGATFGDKINLSNTTNAESWKVEIDSDSDTVVITWWETNQTSSVPVIRTSNDNGATFGPMWTLDPEGPIGGAVEETDEGE